jgi:hypothetical protein
MAAATSLLLLTIAAVEQVEVLVTVDLEFDGGEVIV